MRIFLLALVLLIQEKATLNTPVNLGNITEYEVNTVTMTRPRTLSSGGDWSLNIVYNDNKGNLFTDHHQGIFHAVTNPNGADVLVKQLNKVNLSVKSLNCRAIEHLQGENKIAASSNSCTPE